MEVLDRVYSTFSNLEKDYARSRKSRRDFIVDKFGGDIDIGSMIILDAISNSAITDPEDIEKLTFVKDTIEQIRSMQGVLDSVTDFSAFSASTEMHNFLLLLQQSYVAGTHMRALHQPDYWENNKGSYHYFCGIGGCEYVPFAQLHVISVYNEHMGNSVPFYWNTDEPPEEGALLEIKPGGDLQPISVGRVAKKFKEMKRGT